VWWVRVPPLAREAAMAASSGWGRARARKR
jgi:hypothetical protein